MIRVGIPEQSLPQHGITPRDVLDGPHGERSPCVVHFWGDLVSLQCQPQHLADVGHVLHGHGEKDIFVDVHSLNMVTLGQHLLTKLLAQILKVGTSIVVWITFGHDILSHLAHLDDETSDSLEGEAGDGLGDELMPRGIGVGMKLEIAHDLLSIRRSWNARDDR